MSTLMKLAIVGLVGLVLALAVAALSSPQQKLGMDGSPAATEVNEG